MTATLVNVATNNDFDRVSATITAAFAADPVLRWIFPNAFDYLTYFPLILQGFGNPSLEHLGAHYVEGFGGAALWLPPGVHADDELLGQALGSALAPERLEIMGSMMEQMAAGHPEEPHWYLFAIGVDPAHQRRGLGSVLLRHGLEASDRAGQPAYLESTSAENSRLYQRHGFEAVGTIQVGDSPVITRMLRRPG